MKKALPSPAQSYQHIQTGLNEAAQTRLAEAFQIALDKLDGQQLSTGESTLEHGLGMARIATDLRLDVNSRIAALLFSCNQDQAELTQRFGRDMSMLVSSLQTLSGLRIHTSNAAGGPSFESVQTEAEVLRKMLLGMAQDVRVVLLRLASRTQTLRHFTTRPHSVMHLDYARESLDIYAPLANRLGVWQLKWELEDLSFRFLDPKQYRRIANMLDQGRSQRENFIADVVERLKQTLKKSGIKAEVYGRPKHIYSIYNKMRQKNIDFTQIYDVHALRVLVPKIQDCYTALDQVNQLWQPISDEYDDYISRPKGNHYQSLHTAVLVDQQNPLEVQIRTFDMHQHAEFGIAAHWRYKEQNNQDNKGYDEKIALLRNLLSWRDETLGDETRWLRELRKAAIQDTIYVLTPQGKVIDLPHGSTPIDFAYRLHTELGHRCRGAKINGQLVSLNTVLENGQYVEIITVREGAPSRDWLITRNGFVNTNRARSKIRQYFAHLNEEEINARGRGFINRELGREGLLSISLDKIAERLSGTYNSPTLILAAGRGEISPRALITAARSEQRAINKNAIETDEDKQNTEHIQHQDAKTIRKHSRNQSDQVLVVGVDKLMSSLGRCCKPAPPEHIEGFITRGRGISVHRATCRDFLRLKERFPQRTVQVQWNPDYIQDNGHKALFLIDMVLSIHDRQGILRDVIEVLAREKINVAAVKTLSHKKQSQMRFTLEVSGLKQMHRIFTLVGEIAGVTTVQRGD